MASCRRRRVRRQHRRAMEAVNDADALIIDLRDNGGGVGETALQIAGYLFDRPAFLYDPRPHSRVPSHTASPISGNKLADKPVYLLTSSRNAVRRRILCLQPQDVEAGDDCRRANGRRAALRCLSTASTSTSASASRKRRRRTTPIQSKDGRSSASSPTWRCREPKPWMWRERSPSPRARRSR